MSRTSVLILLGLLVILTPFSGLPSSFRSLLAVIFGSCIAGLGLSQRAREAEAKSAEQRPTTDTFDVTHSKPHS